MALHIIGRLLGGFGHEVKLIAPQPAKPYVKRGKNDAADAEALCEAVSRPTMRFVPMKTTDQQAALMLVGMRTRLIKRRTQLANAIRGIAAEFGVTAATGMCRIEPLLRAIAADETIPPLARELFALHAQEYARLKREIQQVERSLQVINLDQDRLRKNLKEMPPEAAAYKRYLQKFDDQETEIEKLMAQLKQLQADEHAQRTSYENWLANLSVE